MIRPRGARGISLSVKMIATTTALVSLIVALFGYLNVISTRRNFDEQAQRERDSFTESLRKRGLVQTKDLVQPSRNSISENDYSALQSLMPEIARDDAEVAFVFVVDKEGTVLASSQPSQNGSSIKDPLVQKLILLDDAAASMQERQLIFSRPISSESVRLGTVVLGYSLAPLERDLAHIEQKKTSAFRLSWRRTLVLGLLLMLAGSGLAVFQALRITRPIKLLSTSADQIARGDLETRVLIEAGDEIGILGENFNHMADRLAVLMQETAAKATLEKELEVARTIQETLVPPPDLIERPFVKLAGYFLPASHCGGDWWTIHDLPDGRILLVVGDVTGHGVPAAMITAAAKAACDVVRANEGNKLTVTRLLETMNRAIFESAKRKLVMTCFASIIDPVRRCITFANAGHNFPYLFRDGALDGNDFQVLMARGNRLGDLEASSYSERSQPLERGDVLVWYTDGIVECENPRGEEFGEKRFRAAIRRAAAHDPLAMRETIVTTANQFFANRPHKDDITLVVARIVA